MAFPPGLAGRARRPVHAEGKVPSSSVCGPQCPCPVPCRFSAVESGAHPDVGEPACAAGSLPDTRPPHTLSHPDKPKTEYSRSLNLQLPSPRHGIRVLVAVTHRGMCRGTGTHVGPSLEKVMQKCMTETGFLPQEDICSLLSWKHNSRRASRLICIWSADRNSARCCARSPGRGLRALFLVGRRGMGVQ